ncbi:C-type lectin domain family 2 member D-like isoform X10 [Gallus gallus]|uniref:C-type lectin domain family 2 member D-like isoform X10 n=1 Tax=Gallus gallus TaxID=9031 RepID=UPI001AE91757|nr:C-type lectin domain family 2 member D-like isoform X10 [Gallus gallus]
MGRHAVSDPTAHPTMGSFAAAVFGVQNNATQHQRGVSKAEAVPTCTHSAALRAVPAKGRAVSSHRTSQPNPGDLSLRCIKDKLLPIAGTVLVAALLIAVIALAAQKRPPCPPCPTAAPHLPGCPNDGIGVGLQCFYFVEDAADWDGGQRFCLSRGAQLAAVETPQELGFVLRYGRSVQYWIGLRRDRSGPWMWANGSLFNNAFSIEGSGRCAHTDGGGIGSAECSRPKRSVCSRPQRGGAEL